jgi:hypothetical protein
MMQYNWKKLGRGLSLAVSFLECYPKIHQNLSLTYIHMYLVTIMPMVILYCIAKFNS